MARTWPWVALMWVAACRDAGAEHGSSGSGTRGDGSGSGAAPTAGETTGAAEGSGGGPGDADSGLDTGSGDTGGIGIASLRIEFEAATPEQIAIHAPVVGQLAPEATVSVRYRRADTSDWNVAHPLLRIHPEWTSGDAPVPPVDAFAGTIFDLAPGTAYDVELTLTTPGQEPQSTIVAGTTRPLPPHAGPPSHRVTPTDNLQAMLDSLGPGDVLELSAGAYEVDSLHLNVSGTREAPIYIRGVSRPDVVLQDASGVILQLNDASDIVLESLTLRGSTLDAGTAANSRGIAFWDGAVQESVTIRDIDILGVDMGIVASGAVHDVLIYNNDLRGNNEWTADFLHSNLTWNDDGIRVPGHGNAVFDNTLHGFGDSFAVKAGVHSAAVYFYRNRVTMTGDDAHEGDYGTRNIAFYDNYVANAGTLVSLDPVYGGPFYAFRNVAINTFRGPWKLNNTNSGFMLYSNTIVRTEGRTNWGWVQFNNGDLRNWSYRNNLLVYHGASANTLAVEATGCDPIDFTHNAYYPDGDVWWSSSGASYTTMTAAIAGEGQPATTPVFGISTQRHEHGVIVQREPFVDPIPLGADHLTLVVELGVPELAADSTAKNAGVAIPNVTDGYVGSAPDIGAIVEGRPPPIWGATR